MWLLSDAIESGEIVNTCPNQVHGWLQLRGWPRPLYLSLTGNASPGLAGKRVQFEAAPRTNVDQCLPGVQVARQQIGPTGDIALLDDQLVLEWYGQNGHVGGRLQPRKLQVSEAAAGPFEALQPQAEAPGLFATFASLSGPNGPQPAELPGPEDWQRQFDLLDAIMEDRGAEVPLQQLVGKNLQLPAPATLSDEQLQWKVKEILAHLALLGVTLEMCHHFGCGEAYDLLRNRMLPDERVHPSSAQSGYVMHFLTFEHCPQCVAEEASWALEDEATQDSEPQQPAPQQPATHDEAT